jgi:crossover junction endodeoxyribonuclease RuvC
VKSALTGTGRASKEQVQRMVASLLGISSGIPSTDATDALALAICHIHGVGLQKRLATL